MMSDNQSKVSHQDPDIRQDEDKQEYLNSHHRDHHRNSSPASSSPAASIVLLSKHQKGRLKKLFKRASQLILTGHPLSGIISMADWKELQQLLWLIQQQHSSQSDPSMDDTTSSSNNNSSNKYRIDAIGPSIVCRKNDKKQTTKPMVIEVVDHRDLMEWILMMRMKEEKKHHEQDHDVEKNTTTNEVFDEATVQAAPKERRTRKRSHSNVANHDAISSMHTTSLVTAQKEKNNNEQTQQDNIRIMKLPSWVVLHNPMAMEHVGILEVHLPSTISLPIVVEHLIQLIQNRSTDNANTNSKSTSSSSKNVQTSSTLDSVQVRTLPERSILCTNTRWFQGTQPKCITQAMWYSSTPKPPSKLISSSQQQMITTPNLYVALESMTLTPEQWIQEDYPQIQQHMDTTIKEYPESTLSQKENSSNWSTPTSYPTPSEISIDQARTFLEKFKVNVKNDRLDPNHNTTSFVMYSLLSTIGTAGDTTISTKDINKDMRTMVGRVYALDCEMVKTAAGSELARITLLELESYSTAYQQKEGTIQTRLLWDELVRPWNKVTDYLTEYSGVSAVTLNDVQIRIEQIQAALIRRIRPNDIVIGHSLENDLFALRWIHPLVVDTAILFPARHRQQGDGGGCSKFSLKSLAARLLKLDIQRSDQPHCSEEDAATALHLAVRRAVDGPSFGIWDRSMVNRFTTVLAKEGTVVCVGPNEWIREHVTGPRQPPSAIHALACESIHDDNHKAVSAWLRGPTRRARLVWARWYLTDDKNDGSYTNGTNDMEALDKLVKDLMVKVPSHDTVFGIFVQVGYHQAHKMQDLKRVLQNPKTTAFWTDEQELQYLKLLEQCRLGQAIWIGLQGSL